jgi:hypothetical protein
MEKGTLQLTVRGTIERWLPVPDHDGLYEVSNLGQVVSLADRWGKTRRLILRPIVNNCGYGYVNLYRDGTFRHHKIHRLVAACFVPRSKPQHNVVRHLDGNPSNNEWWNLAWGTVQDNVDDRQRAGHTHSGEWHRCAKLTNVEVRAIRRLRAETPKKWTYKALGDKFRVCRQTVWNIVNDRNCRKIPRTEEHL